jgi:hypothetical protein
VKSAANMTLFPELSWIEVKDKDWCLCRWDGIHSGCRTDKWF